MIFELRRLAELPYLDAKAEYIHESTPADILDSTAPVISIDDDNTLESLRDKLAALYENGTGGGFPIVGHSSSYHSGESPSTATAYGRDESLDRSGQHHVHGHTAPRSSQHRTMGPVRMYGYIASKELEHGLASAGLGAPMAATSSLSSALATATAAGSTLCTFRVASALRNGSGTTTNLTALHSTAGTPAGIDLSWLVDSAPLTVSSRAPMELCHEVSQHALRDSILVCPRWGQRDN